MMCQIPRFGTARSHAAAALGATLLILLLGPAGVVSGQAESNGPPAMPPLDPAQQQHLDQMLEAWSIQSRSVRDLRGAFQRETEDRVFHKRETVWGVVYYMAPDKARMDLWTKSDQNWVVDQQFICTGDHVYEVRHRVKQVIDHQLPPGQQGANINQGPLPFLFGMTPEQIKRRYAIRIYKENASLVQIKATPLLAQDRQNFSDAELILNKTTWLPTQLALRDVNGDVYRYRFTAPGIQVNNNLPYDYFAPPKLPLGFRMIVAPMGDAASPQAGPPAAPKRGFHLFRRTGPKAERNED